MESYLVIGGEGFVGGTLVKALVAKYPTATVSSLDLVQRHGLDSIKPLWKFYSADLTSLSELSTVIKSCGATTVFHTASPWTGSGAEICEKVNVQGTQTIVDACLQEGVRKLVFTSSAGVVYNGNDLINVDERLPFPMTVLDAYNVTKAKAETIVLEANGKGNLLTVALRPAGIFGPGDRQAIPGIIDVLKTGKANFQIGDNKNLFDWTFVGNVVHAHLVAAERLELSVSFDELDTRMPPVDRDIPRRSLPTSTYRPDTLFPAEIALNPEFKNTSEPDLPLYAGRNRYDQYYPRSASALEKQPESIPIAGQAFFITNGEPIYFWDFPRAVWSAYNGFVPGYVIALPVEVGLAAASLGENIMWMMGKVPSLTRGKVVYSTKHRYYNIEKARRVLGYEPIVGLQEGIKLAVDWYKADEALKSQSNK